MLSLDSEDDSEEADIKEKKGTTEIVSNIECEDQEHKEQEEHNAGKSNSSKQGETEELPDVTGHQDEEKKEITLEGSDVNKSLMEEDVSQHLVRSLVPEHNGLEPRNFEKWPPSNFMFASMSNKIEKNALQKSKNEVKSLTCSKFLNRKSFTVFCNKFDQKIINFT